LSYIYHGNLGQKDECDDEEQPKVVDKGEGSVESLLSELVVAIEIEGCSDDDCEQNETKDE
jgi:hypothetical protein